MFSFCQGFWDSKILLRDLREKALQTVTSLSLFYTSRESSVASDTSQNVIHPEIHRRHQTSENLISQALAVVNLVSLKEKGTMSNIL